MDKKPSILWPRTRYVGEKPPVARSTGRTAAPLPIQVGDDIVSWQPPMRSSRGKSWHSLSQGGCWYDMWAGHTRRIQVASHSITKEDNYHTCLQGVTKPQVPEGTSWVSGGMRADPAVPVDDLQCQMCPAPDCTLRAHIRSSGVKQGLRNRSCYLQTDAEWDSGAS